MPTIDLLLAELAIRQLHVKYADAVWRKDFVAFGDCFAEDCEWRIGGMILRGRDEIVHSFEGIVSTSIGFCSRFARRSSNWVKALPRLERM